MTSSDNLDVATSRPDLRTLLAVPSPTYHVVAGRHLRNPHLVDDREVSRRVAATLPEVRSKGVESRCGEQVARVSACPSLPSAHSGGTACVLFHPSYDGWVKPTLHGWYLHGVHTAAHRWLLGALAGNVASFYAGTPSSARRIRAAARTALVRNCRRPCRGVPGPTSRPARDSCSRRSQGGGRRP